MVSFFADTVLLSGRILDWPFTITQSLVVYIILAVLIGLAAEFIVGWRLPFGVLGAFLAALLGIWLMNLIGVNIAGDPILYSVPLVKTLLGAIIMVAIWHLITAPAWHRRRRYGYSYRRRRYVEN